MGLEIVHYFLILSRLTALNFAALVDRNMDGIHKVLVNDSITAVAPNAHLFVCSCALHVVEI